MALRHAHASGCCRHADNVTSGQPVVCAAILSRSLAPAAVPDCCTGSEDHGVAPTPAAGTETNSVVQQYQRRVAVIVLDDAGTDEFRDAIARRSGILS